MFAHQRRLYLESRPVVEIVGEALGGGPVQQRREEVVVQQQDEYGVEHGVAEPVQAGEEQLHAVLHLEDGVHNRHQVGDRRQHDDVRAPREPGAAAGQELCADQTPTSSTIDHKGMEMEPWSASIKSLERGVYRGLVHVLTDGHDVDGSHDHK